MARLKNGLSQGRLADLAGVPATMISAYERDKRQPTLPTLLRLLKAAGFELRLQLVPFDENDDKLAKLENKRLPGERGRRERQVAASRDASLLSDAPGADD